MDNAAISQAQLMKSIELIGEKVIPMVNGQNRIGLLNYFLVFFVQIPDSFLFKIGVIV